MNKLDELLEKFRSDKGWNTENRDGSHRFDKEIEWIGRMVNVIGALMDSFQAAQG